MGSEARGVNVESLWRVEGIYRNRLSLEPEDMAARTALAWCLFMQALHRAGEESTLEAVVLADGVGLYGCPHERDSHALLRDSLLNAATVLQLSPGGRERLEVERLQSLVELSVGFAELSEARHATQQILGRIALELETGPTRSPRRRRRKARRKTGNE